jgi:hypothetical protein
MQVPDALPGVRSLDSSLRPAQVTGHPPSADRVVCVDFDGTLVPWGTTLMGERKVTPHIVETMTLLKSKGYRIVIFTSRLSWTWAKAELLARTGHADADEIHLWLALQEEWVAATLKANGVPFDDMTAEKIPAEAYFDDKAIRVDEFYPLNDAIEDFVDGRI